MLGWAPYLKLPCGYSACLGWLTRSPSNNIYWEDFSSPGGWIEQEGLAGITCTDFSLLSSVQTSHLFKPRDPQLDASPEGSVMELQGRVEGGRKGGRETDRQRQKERWGETEIEAETERQRLPINTIPSTGSTYTCISIQNSTQQYLLRTKCEPWSLPDARDKVDKTNFLHSWN